MISPQIARELRELGHDVQAVKGDRPELESVPDEEILRRLSQERWGIVTDNVKDFQPIHNQVLAAGEEHYGMLFTFDDTLPRTRAAISLWVKTLDEFLRNHSDESALHNRVHFLP